MGCSFSYHSSKRGWHCGPIDRLKEECGDEASIISFIPDDYMIKGVGSITYPYNKERRKMKKRKFHISLPFLQRRVT